jgi:hypothetical protein
MKAAGTGISPGLPLLPQRPVRALEICQKALVIMSEGRHSLFQPLIMIVDCNNAQAEMCKYVDNV